MTIPQNTNPNPQAGNGTDPQPQAGNSTPRAGNEPQTTVSLTIAEDLQRQIAELRAENAKHRNKAKEQEQAAQAAEQQRLREQGEFKQLAEQSSARVKELEPVQERYTALSGLLADQIKAQIKDWPKEVRDLLPGDDTPIEVRYSQVQKLQTLATQLASQAQQQQRASLPGNKPGPQPNQNNEQTREQQINDYRVRRRQTGSYNL
ncbi:MAG TPA: hypothetical protein VHV10_16410 [Ktedonobacteraceae bacterium]|jgi:DNA repair exonuclease SbcCD ATPase subunit|nr:hypothetical protein [Ktedonobacteraceae bacterium]